LPIQAFLPGGLLLQPGIEDFFLKSLRMWGNKSPAPPVYALKGGELNPKGIKISLNSQEFSRKTNHAE
jgi:hypothetical protein